MMNAITAWIRGLDEYPGWRDWNRERLGHVLHFDETVEDSPSVPDFVFDHDTDVRTDLLVSYMSLVETASSLREIEWYFRRFPFHDAPVSHHSHLTNCCELYFSRIYQFKERLKRLTKTLKVAVPDHALDMGSFIKTFSKEFEQEMRARNGVHHIERFDDLSTTRISVLGLISLHPEDKGWSREHISKYRKSTREWSARVRRKSERLDDYVSTVAVALLQVCLFLDPGEN
jgi:hypothetical protein